MIAKILCGVFIMLKGPQGSFNRVVVIVPNDDGDLVSAVVPKAGNTGDGTPGAVDNDGAELADWTFVCKTAVANGGVFSVSKRLANGTVVELADLTVTEEYVAGGITLTIADGAADFIVGDTFYLVTCAGAELHVGGAGIVSVDFARGNIIANLMTFAIGRSYITPKRVRATGTTATLLVAVWKE